MSSKILIISMPWQRHDAPSIQLSILKAAMKIKGVDLDVIHAAPMLARKTGRELYWKVANSLHPLLSEALFNTEKHELSAAILETKELDGDELSLVTHSINEFKSEFLNNVRFAQYTAVGFSCTFNQLQASLWAAREAKAAGCKTVFGGFLTFGDMGKELLQNPLVDAVISGRGEDALHQWLKDGCPSGYIEAPFSAEPVIPDYSDYFNALNETELADSSLVVEASYGCEYGACSFCSQNMHKGRQVYDTGFLVKCLQVFKAEYNCMRLEFTDTSFPVEILHDECLCKELRDFNSFTESRILDLPELSLIHKAGFNEIQVGIESLNSNILKYMRKGVSLPETISFLEDVARLGIRIKYNIILDMPGTTEDDIYSMLELIPKIYNLPPPSAIVPFQLQRNSHVYNNPERYKISIQPHIYSEFFDENYPQFYFSCNGFKLPKELLEKAHNAFELWHSSYYKDCDDESLDSWFAPD